MFERMFCLSHEAKLFFFNSTFITIYHFLCLGAAVQPMVCFEVYKVCANFETLFTEILDVVCDEPGRDRVIAAE